MTGILDATIAIGLAKGRVFVRLRDLGMDLVTAPAVCSEVIHQGRGRPGSVALARSVRHGWVQVREPRTTTVERFSTTLHLADRQVLALATDLRADFLLTDDLGIRREANRYGIACLGTPAVVRVLCELGLLTRARPVLDLIRRRGFGVTQEAYEQVLRDLGELP